VIVVEIRVLPLPAVWSDLRRRVPFMGQLLHGLNF
jgi:hypothetical protein